MSVLFSFFLSFFKHGLEKSGVLTFVSSKIEAAQTVLDKLQETSQAHSVSGTALKNQ